METIKIYAKRDSAVSYLRGKGIPRANYADFLTLTADKHYKLDTAEVEHYLKTGVLPEDAAIAKDGGTTVEPTVETNETKNEAGSTSVGGTKKATDKKTGTAGKKDASSASGKKDGKSGATPKEPKRTVSSVCRTLIKEGKTNEEVWETVRLLFDLPDSKKNYPAWYRSDMKKKGLI